jgi:HAD superfamily hydrolase (TIGR01549 family)
MDLRTNKLFKEDNHSIRRPLYIEDLCKFIYDCLDEKYNGIYHFYNPYNRYTKYEICQKIGNFLDINIDKIIQNNTKSEGLAPRPYDTQLQDDKINIIDYSFTNFDETIEKCFNKFKHPKINFQNKDDIFILLDMDGTIIDSNMAHYNAYKRVFEKYNKSFIPISEWNYIISNDNIDNYLRNNFNNEEFYTIKKEKQQFLTEETITFTKNSEIFLDFLIKHNFNFCIVTNANKETVEILKKKLPLLNEIKQWIYRDDYNIPKPNNECYKLAKQKYHKNEQFIIGIEDSMVGYKALKPCTDLIYIYNNESIFKKEDCYLLDDFSIFL